MTDAAAAAGVTAREGAAPGLLAATLVALSSRPRGGPAWLEAHRAEAARRLETLGFPTQRDEAFRFTPLSHVLRVPYAHRAGGARAGGPSGLLAGLAARKLRIENGQPDEPGTNAGQAVEVRRMADVLATEPSLLEPYLGKLAGSQQGFVAENTALFTDGVVVIARPRARGEVVHLAHVGAATGPTLATPRTVVIAEPGSELCLVESHTAESECLESAVTEVFVGAGARVEHVRVEDGSKRAATLSTIAVRQSRDSHYSSRVFSFGGGPTRVELRVELAEPGAECTLDGLYLVGSGEFLDHHTVIVHASPRCSSRERYKGIADGEGVAVFDGTIIVRRGAAGTEAHQENRNLLLSNDAVVHAKPHLEIDTDDVRCSHGATVGRLDPAELFYLRSRGIDAEVARSLLTYAFAKGMVEGVSLPELRVLLEESIAARLPSGALARELA